jgi:hypothetical protein
LLLWSCRDKNGSVSIQELQAVLSELSSCVRGSGKGSSAPQQEQGGPVQGGKMELGYEERELDVDVEVGACVSGFISPAWEALLLSDY